MNRSPPLLQLLTVQRSVRDWGARGPGGRRSGPVMAVVAVEDVEAPIAAGVVSWYDSGMRL